MSAKAGVGGRRTENGLNTCSRALDGLGLDPAPSTSKRPPRRLLWG